MSSPRPDDRALAAQIDAAQTAYLTKPNARSVATWHPMDASPSIHRHISSPPQRRSASRASWSPADGRRELLVDAAAIRNRVDDAGLLERACRGDEAAFSQLFARHQRSIYLYAARMCGADAGDDVVQETFLAVLRQTGRYDPARGSVAGYLFGIARHLVLRQLGSRYNSCLADTPEGVTDAVAAQETALESLTRAETIDLVRAAIESLPPVYREVVVLCELQEMDYAVAADLIQCPIGTVRSRLHRARALLMAKLAATYAAASTDRQ